jgi:hypothetical protein
MKISIACRFYGYYVIEEALALVAQSGNQCALIVDHYAPCQMEIEGQAPQWDRCPLNTPRAARLVERIDSYKRHGCKT